MFNIMYCPYLTTDDSDDSSSDSDDSLIDTRRKPLLLTKPSFREKLGFYVVINDTGYIVAQLRFVVSSGEYLQIQDLRVHNILLRNNSIGTRLFIAACRNAKINNLRIDATVYDKSKGFYEKVCSRYFKKGAASFRNLELGMIEFKLNPQTKFDLELLIYGITLPEQEYKIGESLQGSSKSRSLLVTLQANAPKEQQNPNSILSFMYKIREYTKPKNDIQRKRKHCEIDNSQNQNQSSSGPTQELPDQPYTLKHNHVISL